MNRTTIFATLALLGCGLPLAASCDGPKEVEPAKGKADAKDNDGKAEAKGEMACAPGACGGEGKCGGKPGEAQPDAKEAPANAKGAEP